MYRILEDNSIERHWVHPEEFDKYLLEGWNFGVKPKEELPIKIKEKRHHMHKEGICKVIPESQIEKYLADGWTLECAFVKGRIPHNKGISASSELRQKLSIAHIGEKHAPERIKKHADSMRGRKYMHKDDVNKLIPLGEEEYYLQLGWQLGKTSDKS